MTTSLLSKVDVDSDEEGNERRNPVTQPVSQYDNSELFEEIEKVTKSNKSSSPKNKEQEEP